MESTVHPVEHSILFTSDLYTPTPFPAQSIVEPCLPWDSFQSSTMDDINVRLRTTIAVAKYRVDRRVVFSAKTSHAMLPSFSAPNSDDIKWYVQFRLHANSEQRPAHMALGVGLNNSSSRREVDAEIKLKAEQDADQAEISSLPSLPDIRPMLSYRGDMQRIYDVVNVGAIAIAVRTVRSVRIYVEVHQSEGLQSEVSPSSRESCRGSGLNADLGALLLSGDHSDALLVVRGRELRAHRAILSARSEVFRAMFKYDTKERKTGRVLIEDATPNTIQDILRFIYTEEAPSGNSDNSERLLEVLVAADKYQLPDLRHICRTRLMSCLTADSVCRSLRVSQISSGLSSSSPIRSVIVEYVRKNLQEILISSAWRDLEASSPSLACTVLREAVTANIDK